MHNRILDLRLTAGLSQDDLAAKVGVTRRVVSSWERGERSPRLADVPSIARALHVTPNDLCGWYDDRPRESDFTIPRDEAELLANFRACTGERRRQLVGESKRLRAATRVEAESIRG